MASSSEYLAKVDKFKSIKAQVSAVTGKVTACSDAITAASEYINGIIISGDSIDQGELTKEAAGKIKGISGDLEEVMAECSKLIQKYDELYRQAKAAEEAAAYEAHLEELRARNQNKS